MKRLHYAAGIFLSLFIVAHLINHLASLAGVATHQFWMEQLRLIYRHPLVEYPLVITVLLQVFSGLKLFWKRRKQAQTTAQQWQGRTGAYLAFFLLMHLSAILAGRLVLQVDTDFYYGAKGLNTFPLYFFFVPYYSLAILAFFGHIASIHVQKMSFPILGLSPKQQAWGIVGLGVLCTIGILWGMTDWGLW